MTDQASRSSSEPASSSPPVAKHYKVIVAIGLLGEGEDASRFAALWVADSERRAHRINQVAFDGRLTLLPLPEEKDEMG